MKKLILIIILLIVFVSTGYAADTFTESSTWDRANQTTKLSVAFVGDGDNAGETSLSTPISGYLTMVCTTPSASITDNYDIYLLTISVATDTTYISDILDTQLVDRDTAIPECVRFSNPPQLDYKKTYYLNVINNAQASGATTIDFFVYQENKH